VTDAEISEQPDWKTTFPAHCLRGTPGQKKIPETALRDPLVIEPARGDAQALGDRLRGHRGDILLHKHRFDVFTNENVTTVLNLLDPEDIVLYGVATDVCDKAAVQRPMIGHRSSAMERLLQGLEQPLARLFRTSRTVLVGTTSATGFMEMAVRNGVRQRALSLVNGSFSERFAKLVGACGKECI